MTNTTGRLDRRSFLRTVSLGVGVSAFAVSGVPRSHAAGKEIELLTMALKQDPKTLDPHMHVSRPNLDTLNQVYEQLVHRDAGAAPSPGLATAWKSTSDTVWRFELRKGVKFHGGELFTAESVKYSYDRIRDPNQKSPMASILRHVKDVRVVGDFAVEVETKAPTPVLPAFLNLFTSIASKSWLTQKGDQTAAKTANGTGPFKLVEWQRNDYLKFVRNDDYWQARAPIKQLLIKPIPEASTRVLALRKGEVDIAQEIPPSLADDIKKDPNLRVSAVPSIRVHFCHLRADTKPLGDKRVRQALNYAVDKQAIIKHVLKGYGAELTQLLTPVMFGYNPELPGYRYDPGKAKALLREAGYPKGFSLEMAGYTEAGELVEAVANYLREVGVEVSLKIDEYKTMYENLMKKRASPITYHNWGNWNLFDADGTLPYILLPSQWCYAALPPRVQELSDLAARTLDPKRRLAAYHEAMKLIHEEAPLLLLFQQYDINATNRKTTWETRKDNVMLVYGAQAR